MLNRSCELHQIDEIIHLAAQAGVRYSIEAPQEYIDSNITGFLNVVNVARDREVSHLIYASSSSVYGDHNEVPYSTRDRTDRPASIYASSKVANELMAHVYHEQFALSVTGLRFFTVYGPWGRPDMSPFIFLNALLRRETIRLFNNGDHSRDFTYIDDIVEGVIRVADDALVEPFVRVYNIGRGEPVGLLDYVQVLKQLTGYEAITMLEPKQPGDVAETFADVTSLQRDFGYAPAISLEDGLKAFVNWYRAYYQV